MIQRIITNNSHMTDNRGKIVIKTAKYRSPQVKTILIKTQEILCQSPAVSGWTGGSDSDDIDMED